MARAPWQPPFVAGLLAMLAAIGVQEAVAGLDQSIPSAPSAAAQTIVRLTPGAFANLMIEALGKNAILLLIAGSYLGAVLFGGLLGLLAGRLAARGRRRLAAALLIVVPFGLYLLVAPAQLRGAHALPLAAAGGLLTALLFAGLTLLLWRGLDPAAAAPAGTTTTVQRRALLGGGLVAVGLLAGGGLFVGRQVRAQGQVAARLTPLEPLPTLPPTRAPVVVPAIPPTATPAPAATVAASSIVAAPAPTATPPTPSPHPQQIEERFFDSIAGMTTEITPTERFYIVDEAIDDPRIDLSRWRLCVGGQVERPFMLTFDELRALPAVEQEATLMCISYEPGQDLISNAIWRGVRLADLLQRAGVNPDASEALLRSVDDYDESFPIAKALEPTTLLAYGMNGALLPVNHGAPLRAIVPGHYGFKHVKWLAEIEVVAGQHAGYWERKAGWNQVGRLSGVVSRIDTVATPPVRAGVAATIGGIAFASPTGVSRVEVSTDGGQTWAAARLKRTRSPLSWRLWAYEWRPSALGHYDLRVRAYDGGGIPQIAAPRPAYPDGSTGIHGWDDFLVVP